jgi:tetratricopeptide (TPR) repeat protein
VNSSPHGPELDRLSDLWAAQPESTCFAPLAEALRKRGALEQATAIATTGIASHPEYLPGRLVMARIYADQGESESAEAEVRAAIAIDETNPVALTALTALATRLPSAAILPTPLELPVQESPLASQEPQAPQEPLVPRELPVRQEPPAPQEPASAEVHLESIEMSEAEAEEPSEPPADEELPGDHHFDDESVVPHDAEPVLTESLAMLYRGQGHLGQAVEVLDALVARAPDNSDLMARRDAIRAEFDLTRPRPYDAAQSGGTPLRAWLAGMATSRATPPETHSSFDAFYQPPATPPSEAGDLAAFQSWLRELGR